MQFDGSVQQKLNSTFADAVEQLILKRFAGPPGGYLAASGDECGFGLCVRLFIVISYDANAIAKRRDRDGSRVDFVTTAGIDERDSKSCERGLPSGYPVPVYTSEETDLACALTHDNERSKKCLGIYANSALNLRRISDRINPMRAIDFSQEEQLRS